MESERWRRITQLSEAARNLDPVARRAFLDEACGRDEILRREIESLLGTLGDTGRAATGPATAAASSAPAGAPLLPLAGRRLSHYLILDSIGAGGMGEVYRAHDDRLDRDVAIKVLGAAHFTDPDARSRLVREARTASRLNHPHVCTIYEVGESDGYTYIVMELVEGQALSVRLADGPLSVEETLRYGSQLADALCHAHARGVVHRDFKSANVVIAPDGRAKVLDFGLAKRVKGSGRAEVTTDVSLTAPGSVVGTLAYMAPEQLLGRPADARCDVWALGVVLYEMLTGVHPFRGSTPYELSLAILSEPPAPLPSDAPPAIAAVIERCLEKDLDERCREAAEVRSALEAIQSGAVSPAATPPSRLERRRLAVLPLQNLSGDSEQEYFVDGTHEALITDLACISGLRVIARSSVMRFKGRDVPLDEVAEQLKIDIALTGSVMRLGDRVRITVQLVDVATDEHLWAGRYERELLDVLSLQNEIVSEIAHAVELQLTPRERERLARRRPVNPEAYEAYLKGRFHWYKISREHWKTAQRYFEIALEKQPDYALAHVGLASTWQMLGDAGVVPPDEAFPKLRAAAAKAAALDDGLAEVHELLANIKFLYEWDWNGAEREFRRAIELNPGHADTRLFYADFLMAMTRRAEAEEEMARTLELDPVSPFIACFQGWHLVYLRRYDEAVAELQRALRTDPSFSSAHLGLWGAFYAQGRHPEALEHARRFFQALGDDAAVNALGAGGSYAEAMARAASTLVERVGRAHVPAVRIARLYAHAADPDRTCAWLETAYTKRETPLIHLAVGWDWDGLRGDPRFQRLLRRMNLPGA